MSQIQIDAADKIRRAGDKLMTHCEYPLSCEQQPRVVSAALLENLADVAKINEFAFCTTTIHRIENERQTQILICKQVIRANVRSSPQWYKWKSGSCTCTRIYILQRGLSFHLYAHTRFCIHLAPGVAVLLSCLILFCKPLHFISILSYQS